MIREIYNYVPLTSPNGKRVIVLADEIVCMVEGTANADVVDSETQQVVEKKEIPCTIIRNSFQLQVVVMETPEQVVAKIQAVNQQVIQHIKQHSTGQLLVPTAMPANGGGRR